ncbi:hypothetical protein RBH29_05380 [Herbivorax sp. ANBcel31]|uniref:hypothetical protein n=1 Tax=Herbivorax sp. ANBcel31 TaxID=3069754 RepID=UPI0027B148C2|nr:hypothetical protein [Herbivorax sp. ANBcel31]MDQ2085868.1 hypothetical protein [Herbivorax sp. ANBcel31]
MNNIYKLPFITGTFVTILVGMISYKTGIKDGEIYIRMSISMVVFFITGVYLKNFILKINEELKQKEERLKEQERLEKEKKNDEKKGKRIDLKAEEEGNEPEKEQDDDQKLYDEEFKPLKVNSVKVNKEDEN